MAKRFSPGARYMAGSALAFSVMTLFVKAAGRSLPSQEIVLARGAVSLAIAYALLRRARLRPWGTHRRLLLVRGGLGFAALSCFYYALVRLPLAEATVIQYTNPIWTAVLAALLLRERTGRRVFACALVSLAGVILVAGPGSLFGGSQNIGLVAIALLGALLAAGAYVTVRHLGSREHTLVIVFYFPLVTVPATLPAVASELVVPRGASWLLLAGVGVASLVGQLLLTRGLALEKAGRAMSISYLQIAFAALWGFLFFGEVPGVATAVGAAVIVAASVVVAVGDTGRRAAPASADGDGDGAAAVR